MPIRQLGFGFTVTANSFGVFNPRNDAGFVAAVAAFENVSIVSFRARVTAPQGTSGEELYGWFLPETNTINNASFAVAFHADHTFVSDQIGTSVEVALPSAHLFGRSVKGNYLGNPPPKFACCAPQTSICYVRIFIEVECSGDAPI
jgi:hypothetical protein